MKLSAFLIIVVIGATPWVWNAYKFANCDFESDFKCEVIHGTGVFIPPASWITVWFSDDSD